MDDLIAVAEAAADAAGAAILPYYRQGVGADLKGDNSPVTIADRAAEEVMRALLSQRFPGHGILGEEGGLDRPGARLRWVLDPIDGTRAFITGRPTFGVLVALMDGPTPILGVIDQPVTGERWVGAAGRPTTFRGAHGRAGCRPCPALDAAELSCTAPEIFTPAQTEAWRRLQAATRRTSWGGDCYAYGLLALGGIDVIAEPGLQVWDWAALVPVIEGAGGRVTDWTGQPMHPDGDGCTLAVGDPALLGAALALLSAPAPSPSGRGRRRLDAARPTPCYGGVPLKGPPMLRALALLLLAATALAHLDPAQAQPAVTRSHAITILGAPALPAGFPRFPYVNPDAPKGGEAAFGMTGGSFDGFNPYILRGNSAFGLGAQWQPGVGGTAAGTAGGHVWESLLTGSADETATGYGLLAETIEVPADGMWIAFEIRPEARFADGAPVLASDVAWTFKTLMEKGRPSYRVIYADVQDCVAEGERRVVFHFKTNANRDLPLIVGGMAVLPEHWWATRDFTRPLTEPPLGSGPYRVERFDLGRSVTYARRPDWWAKDLPVGIGFHNLDRVRLEYYGDPIVLLEAFKAGQVDYREENISKQWATAYDFPAVRSGLVRKQDLEHRLPIGIQGWIMNTRRGVFKDVRVREALGQVWDFEWTNRNLFYGAYVRSTSYFGNTPQEAAGVPDAAETALLEPFRASLPPALFTEPFAIPVTDGSGNNRDGLRKALGLLREAGWTVRDRKLVNEAGEQMQFTILLNEPSLERIALPFVQWLGRLGIEVKLRTVDRAQFERLTDDYDYDMTTMIYPGSDLPGNELRDSFTCEGAKTPGGSNMAGVCSPAVDALVDRMVQATDRATLAVAGRALDRVLLRGWYLIPHYHNKAFRIATWDRFGRPEQPVRDGFVLDSWWVDPVKAAKVDAARGTEKR